MSSPEQIHLWLLLWIPCEQELSLVWYNESEWIRCSLCVVSMHVPTHPPRHIHARMHAHTHTLTHAHTHTQTHTHYQFHLQHTSSWDHFWALHDKYPMLYLDVSCPIQISHDKLLTSQSHKVFNITADDDDTFDLSLFGWYKLSNHTLPSDSLEYMSSWVEANDKTLSNFFCPGPHSCLAKCKFPINTQASAHS